MGKRKYIIAVAVVIIVIVAGIYCYLEHKEREFKLITDEGEMSLFVKNVSQKELDEYYRKVDELLAQDIYGGETPEETLNLYIQALEAGDLELASKYFILQDQEEELGELGELNKGELTDYLARLKLEKRISYLETFNEYEFDIFRNGEYMLIARFKQVEQSGLWKMESI